MLNKTKEIKKILIIRFSSIGDLAQSLSLPSFIKSFYPNAEIHFVTRQDLSEILMNHPAITKIWTLDRKKGFRDLLSFICALRKEKFSHIYDAHNNLRSLILRTFIPAKKKLVRPMYRFKRFLLLKFHKNLFEMPFSGQRDLIKPLEKWGMNFKLPKPPQLFIDNETQQSMDQLLSTYNLIDQNFLVLIPSATYELKRWPMIHWQELVLKNFDLNFVVLAGPKDDFTAPLSNYPNVVNLTGKTSLVESAAIIQRSKLVIANDTGLLHFAEQLGKPAIALMGPAPFGFPSRPSTTILEKDLPCRPCSKHGQGPCVNKFYQECLVGITSDFVNQQLKKKLSV